MAHLAQFHNKIFVLVLSATLLCNCGATEIRQGFFLIADKDEALKNNNGTIFYNKKLFTGVVFSLYPQTSDTAYINYYADGRENGTWKKFYPGHVLKEQREFEKGRKTGSMFAYWPDGKKQLHYVFKNDEYEGTCREWNTNGMLVKEMNYKAGHEEGMQTVYYDNGKVKSNYVIKDGRRYGLLGSKNCVNVSDSIFKK